MCQLTGPSGRQSGRLPSCHPHTAFHVRREASLGGGVQAAQPLQSCVAEQRLVGCGGKQRFPGPTTAQSTAGSHSGFPTPSSGRTQGGAVLMGPELCSAKQSWQSLTEEPARRYCAPSWVIYGSNFNSLCLVKRKLKMRHRLTKGRGRWTYYFNVTSLPSDNF